MQGNVPAKRRSIDLINSRPPHVSCLKTGCRILLGQKRAASGKAQQHCQIQPSWLKWMPLQLPCFTFFKEGAPKTIQECLCSHLDMIAMNLSVSIHVHCPFSLIRVAHTVYRSYRASHSEHLEFKDKLTASSLYVSI